MTGGRFELGAVDLQYGGHLPAAFLSYRTFGELNAKKDNAILFPTWCTGTTKDIDWIIGPGRALDPNRYFIIGVDMFGNGMSSSPSNTPPPFDRSRFPRISILDNAKMERRLVREKFGIEKLTLVIGRSMGAQVAFQWGSYFPDEVELILPMSGSARTAQHNYVYLACLKMALTSDPEWRNGEYQTNPIGSMRRFRLTVDSWGLSQTWYRQGRHLALGFKTTQDFLDREVPAAMGDVNNLLAQLATWEVADISDNDRFKKDFPAALRAITPKAMVMPSRTDLYFPPEDSEIEVASMPNAELRVIPSIWGHRGAAPGSDPADIEFFDRAIADLLAR